MKYCIDVYVKKKKWWMKKYDFKEKNGKYGMYYTIKTNKRTRNKVIRRLKWKHIRYRSYEACWERSSDYRSKFFKNNSEPFHCRYCNKKLNKDTVVVDHVISVYQTKKNKTARFLLKIRGIENVNDIRNLVPSCWKCNEVKGEKLGFWPIRAFLGKYKAYWVVKPIITIGIILFVLYYIAKSGAIQEMMQLFG